MQGLGSPDLFSVTMHPSEIIDNLNRKIYRGEFFSPMFGFKVYKLLCLVLPGTFSNEKHINLT
jgi:hypothetical protein